MTDNNSNLRDDALPCGVLHLDQASGVRHVNAYLRELLRLTSQDPSPVQLSDLLTPAADLYVQTTVIPTLQLVGTVDEAYLTLRPRYGPDVPILVNARLRPDHEGSDWVCIRVEQRSRWEFEMLQAKRLADERRIENEVQTRALEATSAQLAAALNDVRESHWLLRKAAEVLPTCMYCHRVRGDADQWQSAMDYLRNNTTFLSHGCCPACRDHVMHDLGMDDDPAALGDA
jgi:hypothetical protein